ncbi:hypothetical protein PHMEG_00041722 [Phytophthora megakarya]|uniref:Secreted protein n=1 Tax=Phytophthora megakarya TaxID=4795 RepID=A0A225UBC1_9STRA|nr:hypothetical protein PHMEG_00041722 [Phytophthora megakarya]
MATVLGPPSVLVCRAWPVSALVWAMECGPPSVGVNAAPSVAVNGAPSVGYNTVPSANAGVSTDSNSYTIKATSATKNNVVVNPITVTNGNGATYWQDQRRSDEDRCCFGECHSGCYSDCICVCESLGERDVAEGVPPAPLRRVNVPVHEHFACLVFVLECCLC